ncbi:hypothetical protein B4Z32_24695, partial [Salmonella enterica]|nr:hypothetical protein [Salmonella enterica]
LLLLSDFRLNCLLSQNFMLMTILLLIKNRTFLIVMVEKEGKSFTEQQQLGRKNAVSFSCRGATH